MPGPEYYQGMSLVEALRALAEHHWAVENRHISEYEFELLQEAADHLERDR
jgi:hypothetical protein